MDKLSFQEKVQELESKYGDPVFVESPLITNTFKAANDWKFAKEIIFGKFKVSVGGEKDILLSTKDELISYVTDKFSLEDVDKIKIQNIQTNKTITLRREDFI